MLGGILIAIGIFIGSIVGVLLGLKVSMPTSEKRRQAINKLMQSGMKQHEAEDKVDQASKRLRKIYYAIMAVGAVVVLSGGLITAFCSKGGV